MKTTKNTTERKKALNNAFKCQPEITFEIKEKPPGVESVPALEWDLKQ